MICYSYNKQSVIILIITVIIFFITVIITIIFIIVVIIVIIVIIIRYKSFTNTKKIEKLQKNNVQNTVKREYIRFNKENDISNASNGTKTKNKVKSVVIIGDSMIKHLNGWDMSTKAHKSECKIYVK